MTLIETRPAPSQRPLAREPRTPADAFAVRTLYRSLYENIASPQARATARRFLDEQLQRAGALQCDLPDAPQDIAIWLHEAAAQAGHAYADYLAQRKAGAPRRYFAGKAHALNFLRGVAPTKQVDGAWLYGSVQYIDDLRWMPLIRTYLDELGNGVGAHNHVLMYRKLLAEFDLDDEAATERALSDEHYMQGAIQLALGAVGDEFIPELLGFNLGYEQLPLHLLITAFELNELGIDPQYFTVHVTVDNLDSGHAHMAAQALTTWQRHQGKDFMARVRRGYLLNELGIGSTDIIARFDAGTEVLRILCAKSVAGRNMHADYCRIGGRSINEWLANEAGVAGLLQAMQDKGWIKRHQSPANSRFWQLIEGDGAQMFGVFTRYERQVIHAWIAGDALADEPIVNARARRRLLDTLSTRGANAAAGQAMTGDSVLRRLEIQLAACSDRQSLLRTLIPMIAPDRHFTPEGLMATRILAKQLVSTH